MLPPLIQVLAGIRTVNCKPLQGHSLCSFIQAFVLYGSVIKDIVGIGHQTLDSDSESMTLWQCAKTSNHFSMYFFLKILC
mgnify:CR=1 FL=1